MRLCQQPWRLRGRVRRAEALPAFLQNKYGHLSPKVSMTTRDGVVSQKGPAGLQLVVFLGHLNVGQKGNMPHEGSIQPTE